MGRFWVSYYQKYALYEPTEGGYYYECRERIKSRFFRDETEARKELEVMGKYYEFVQDHEDKWSSDDPADRKYIGHGNFWVLENRRGKYESGRKLYE